MGVSVVFEGVSDALEVVPGQEVVQVLRVENTGMVVDRMLVDVLGDAAEWAHIEPAQVNLLPGATERVRVAFRPPRASSTPPGEVPFALRVMSTEDPEGSSIEEGVVVVGEFGELGARLVPRSATGRRSSKFRLVVENHGNRPEDVRIEPLDPDSKLGFKSRPSVFVAQPGTATFVRLKTVPRKTFFRGPNRTLPFEVSAMPEQGDPARTEGVMLEKQTLPEWLFPTLGVLALLCGLLLVLWLTVLRPVVNSAATAAGNASSAAAQAQHAAGSAQSAANNAASNAKSGAAPTTLSVKLASANVLTGSSDLATATGTTSSGSAATPPLVWSSSNPAVATVTQKGLVTAVSPGTATITATSASSPSSAGSGGSTPSPDPTPSATNAEGTAFSLAGDAVPTATGTVAATPGSTTSVVSGSVTIDVVGPVSVSTNVLPQGVLGKTYSESLGGAGGTGAYSWSVSQGSLPPGFTLSPDGVLSGTPTIVGTTTFKVQLANAGPPAQFSAKTFSLAVVDAPAVDTSSLPGATVGGLYTQTLTAVFGTAPYTWSLVPGQGVLPNGLTLNASTGVISGTPGTVGTFAFNVQVTDSAKPNQSATQQLTIVVADQLTIGTASKLPIEGVKNAPYSLTMNAFGGSAPYTWSVSSGSLPLGLTLNSVSGVISGTPTVPGAYPFTVQVVSPGPPAQTVTKAVTLTVVTAPAVKTSTLPGGITTIPYSQTLAGTAGTTPYTWTLVPGQGTLPLGLALTPGGVISGTPNTTGTYNFTVQLADSTSPSQTATQNLSITVSNVLKSTTPAALPAEGVKNVPYSAALSAIGGTLPYKWSITSGSLPLGLSLNATTGVISGTPTVAALAPFTVSLTDSSVPAQSIVPEPITLTIVQAPAVKTSSLPGGIIGDAYTQTLAGSFGTAPYTWSLVPGQGTLPLGLTLTSTGLISGNPTTAGTYGFTVELDDSTVPSQTATLHLSIAVSAPLVISSQSLPDGVTGTAYSQTLTATGGTQPYTWSVTSGGLPAGLTLNASTGVISGTPTAVGPNSFTVSLSDSSVPVQDATPRLFSLPVVQTPAVQTSSLPDALLTAPHPYSQTLVGAFGTASYTWSLVPGQGVLPPNLILATDGVISGTPTTAGTYTFVVQLTDSSAPALTATKRLSISVVTSLSVNTLELPTGVVGTAYSQPLTATGGTAPYTWTLTSGSELPAGLTLNASTGVITGTPSKAGAATFTVNATDSGNPSQVAASTSLTLTVVNPLVGTNSSLPPAADGTLYTSPAFTAIGGTAPYTFTVTGTLPDGIAPNASNQLTGTPTETGVFPFAVQITDGSSPPLTTTESLSLTVTGSLHVTTQTLPDALVGQAYSKTLTASGGTNPYTWSIASGSPALPAGLTLDPVTGVVSGTPSGAAAASLITFEVTDTGPPTQSATAKLNLAVVEPLSFSMPQIPDFISGSTTYSVTPVSVSGGSGDYTWSETGTLPNGLVLDPKTGTIAPPAPSTATPTATPTPTPANATPGTYPIELTLNDGQFGVTPLTVQISITVVAPLAGPTTPQSWTAAFNTPFSQTVQVSGGQGPYTYSFTTPSAVPSWLSIDPTTGVVSGTPDLQCANIAPPTSTTSPEVFSCPFPVPVTPSTVSVTVTDKLNEAVTSVIPLTVSVPPLTVSYTATTTQTAGTAFSFSAASPSGGYGDASYHYTATGLPCSSTNVCDTIDQATGVISGNIGDGGTAPGPTSTTTPFKIAVTITEDDPVAGSTNKYVATIMETINVVTPAGS